jgi:hypothetical protein
MVDSIQEASSRGGRRAMKIASLCLSLLIAIWGLAPVFAQDRTLPAATDATTQNAPPPVVLELFTSQACAFCPPADALMGQMIEQQSIIGLSCHVDYFGVRQNSLGKSFCTNRQINYNRLIGTGPRYTPQLVVNGHMDMIGYETGKVSAAILKARAEKVKPISLASTGGGSYTFSLPEATIGSDPVTLWMAVFDTPKPLAITEGNNFGKKVTYYNVVSRLDDLGAWDGKPTARTVNPVLTAENGGIAVIAQNTRTGHIVAAGQTLR